MPRYSFHYKKKNIAPIAHNRHLLHTERQWRNILFCFILYRWGDLSFVIILVCSIQYTTGFFLSFVCVCMDRLKTTCEWMSAVQGFSASPYHSFS